MGKQAHKVKKDSSFTWPAGEARAAALWAYPARARGGVAGGSECRHGGGNLKKKRLVKVTVLVGIGAMVHCAARIL